MNSDQQILGIVAKQPLLGTVKTRLARTTSPEFACCVAEAFLEDSLDRLEAVEATRVIVYAPADAADYFAQMSKGRYELMVQTEGDLGDRLRGFFACARQQGYVRMVAIGTDSPTLPVEYVAQAFRLLDTHDVVIGPACDGGYYLVGTGTKDVDLFRDIPWSTPGVLTETLRRVSQASATFALLPPWYDVDTADDWAMLRGHVRAMRLAGIDPRVPRVERLMNEPRPSGIAP